MSVSLRRDASIRLGRPSLRCKPAAQGIKDARVPVFHVNEESALDEVLSARYGERRDETSGVSAPLRFVIRSFPLSYPRSGPVINPELVSLRFATPSSTPEGAKDVDDAAAAAAAAATTKLPYSQTFAIIAMELGSNPRGKRVAYFARASE